MPNILDGIIEDAKALKETIKGARDTATLSNAEAQRCFTGLALVLQVAKTAGSLHPPGAAWDRALPEFMRWPSKAMPCPKCDDMKCGKLYYIAESKDGPERIQHMCRCGYSIFTKPSDRSTDEFGHWSPDETEWSSPFRSPSPDTRDNDN